MNQITFTKAIEGYLLHAHSRRLSPRTIADYTNTFRKFQAHLDADPPLASITLAQIESFFAAMDGLSKKTLINYHTGLSALWTWATKRGIVAQHIIRMHTPPRPEKTVIETYTEAEVQQLLNACDYSQSYKRPGKRKCSNRRPTAQRDKAIILTLLDAMLRVTELCQMLRSNTDLKAGKIKVTGKGDKERYVPISSETAAAIWQYLAQRERAKPRYDDRVFLTQYGRPMDKDSVGRVIRRLGQRVNVEAHPHKFRHTGATEFIRNGGSALELKEILGHSTMTMVLRYVHLAQVDIDEAHRRASPVYNWDLHL